MQLAVLHNCTADLERQLQFCKLRRSNGWFEQPSLVINTGIGAECACSECAHPGAFGGRGSSGGGGRGAGGRAASAHGRPGAPASRGTRCVHFGAQHEAKLGRRQAAGARKAHLSSFN